MFSMSKEQNQDAYIEENIHYKINRGELTNHYAPGTQKFDLFERGWIQAQKFGSLKIGEQIFSKLGRKPKRKPRASKVITRESYLRRRG